MVNSPAAKSLDYERGLQAIGRLAEKQRLRDLCVLEVEGGVLLQGQALVSSRDGFNLVSKTKILSHNDLERMIREL